MRKQLLAVTVLVSVMTSSLAVFAWAPSANACSFEPTYVIDLLALEGADPDDPLAALADDYALWLAEGDGQWATNGPRSLPRLVGAWYERTIVRVEGSEEWMGVGGVAVVDDVWGTMPAPLPRQFFPDDTSCSGFFEPPDIGDFQLNYEGDGFFWIRSLSTVEDQLQAKEILTSLFGEPTQPPRSEPAERAALAQVTSSQVAGPVVWIEPQPGASTQEVDPQTAEVETPTSDETAGASAPATEADGGFPWVIAGIGIVGFVALAGVALVRSRQ